MLLQMWIFRLENIYVQEHRKQITTSHDVFQWQPFSIRCVDQILACDIKFKESAENVIRSLPILPIFKKAIIDQNNVEKDGQE